METGLIFKFFSVVLFWVGVFTVPYLIQRLSSYLPSKQKRMEKKIMEVCKEEGLECTKDDGELNIKRRGVNYRILLYQAEGTKSVRICFQYQLILSELEHVHWAGQLIIENMLCNKHPLMGFFIDSDNHVLYAHYWADIRNADDFKVHFALICDRVRELQNDITELLPRICQDFQVSDTNIEKTTIGFR